MGSIGSYASCDYDLETIDHLVEWCLQNGIPSPVKPSSFHTTLLYSRTIVQPQDIVDLEIALDVAHALRHPIEMKACGFRLFDSMNGPDRRSLVIELDAPQLVDIHNQLIKSGGTHDYDDYVPHVTVSYRASANFDLTALTLPTFIFRVLSMKAEPIDLNWTV